MRNLQLLLEYMRSHISSRNANAILWGAPATDRQTVQTVIIQVTFLTWSDASRVLWWINSKGYKIRTCVDYKYLGSISILGFSTVLINFFKKLTSSVFFFIYPDLSDKAHIKDVIVKEKVERSHSVLNAIYYSCNITSLFCLFNKDRKITLRLGIDLIKMQEKIIINWDKANLLTNSVYKISTLV